MLLAKVGVMASVLAAPMLAATGPTQSTLHMSHATVCCSAYCRICDGHSSHAAKDACRQRIVFELWRWLLDLSERCFSSNQA